VALQTYWTFPVARRLCGDVWWRLCGCSRDVRNGFFFKFWFGFDWVVEKNSDLVRNEFYLVRFAKTRFGSDSYLLL